MTSAKKPIYKKWWFWVIAVIVLSAIIPRKNKEDSPTLSNQMHQSNQMQTDTLVAGQIMTTEYSQIRLNKVSVDKAGDGNWLIILNATFKNITKIPKMPIKGSLFINYNGKYYDLDQPEPLIVYRWMLRHQINPLISETINMVYKIPADMRWASFQSSVYWVPGLNLNPEGKRFFCGNLRVNYNTIVLIPPSNLIR